MATKHIIEDENSSSLILQSTETISKSDVDKKNEEVKDFEKKKEQLLKRYVDGQLSWVDKIMMALVVFGSIGYSCVKLYGASRGSMIGVIILKCTSTGYD